MRNTPLLHLVPLLAVLPGHALAVRLRLPLDDTQGEHILGDMVIGVDHDPVDHGGAGASCTAYDGHEGFPYCYDGHDGNDYLLANGFAGMDEGLVHAVAAASGTVVKVRDGEYDRCHGDLGSLTIDCDGHEMASNHVVLEHGDGSRTEYHHLKKGSVMVAPGDIVTCGQPLGLVGSSGYSAMPHLHFEVRGPEGTTVDPYAGPRSQATSFWVNQDAGDGLPGAECGVEEWPATRLDAGPAATGPAEDAPARAEPPAGPGAPRPADPLAAPAGCSAAGELYAPGRHDWALWLMLLLLLLPGRAILGQCGH